MKIDFSDVTFLIPVRIDSVIRIENLIATIRFLQKNFHTNIIVLEANTYKNKILERCLSKSVKYVFNKDNDPIFFRTHYLNCMTKMAKTEIVAIWDADVIAPKKQLLDSVNSLRSHLADVALPYDGRFVEVTSCIREYYIESPNIRLLTSNIEKMYLPYGLDMYGGAIFVNRKRYMECGMENEKFYGWGPEDQERIERMRRKGCSIYRSKGVLFHMTHPRNLNGGFNSELQKRRLNKELFETKGWW